MSGVQSSSQADTSQPNVCTHCTSYQTGVEALGFLDASSLRSGVQEAQRTEYSLSSLNVSKSDQKTPQNKQQSSLFGSTSEKLLWVSALHLQPGERLQFTSPATHFHLPVMCKPTVSLSPWIFSGGSPVL